MGIYTRGLARLGLGGMKLKGLAQMAGVALVVILAVKAYEAKQAG